MEDSIEDFWDKMHTKKAKSELSGSTYSGTVGFLELENYVVPGSRVLEVGVGFGYVTKDMHDLGVVVSALDISEVGLERVKSFCEFIFRADELEKIPSNYFDCIIMSNVVQHVPTDILVEELTHFARALKQDGVFAIQFISSISSKLDDTWSKGYFYTGGLPGFCRTTNYMERLISTLGCSCSLIKTYNSEANKDINGHVYHIRRNNNV